MTSSRISGKVRPLQSSRLSIASSNITTPSSIYRSHSGDSLNKRKSSLIRKPSFSSRPNLHKVEPIQTIVPEDRMLIDDEPIELVGGSAETLSDGISGDRDNTYAIRDQTFQQMALDPSTFNLTFIPPQTPAQKNITFSKKIEETPSQVNATYDLPAFGMDETATYNLASPQEREPLNDTFNTNRRPSIDDNNEMNVSVIPLDEISKAKDVPQRSRLSADLAEQMLQQGVCIIPALNSTMHNDRLLDVTGINPPQLMDMTVTLDKNTNVTNLLCLSLDQETNVEVTPNQKLDETLVAELQVSNIEVSSFEEPVEDGANNKNIVETEKQNFEIKTGDGATSNNNLNLENERQNFEEQIPDGASCSNEAQEMEPPVLLRDKDRSAIPPKQRFSLGLDLTEYICDCSIELCDMSNSSSMQQNKSHSQNTGKQCSFEMDESLGILTPDQMKEFLDSTRTNPSSHLQLQLSSAGSGHRSGIHHQCRVDLTPSPEELPLDPVGVKTDIEDEIEIQGQDVLGAAYPGDPSLAESDPKTDQMTKSGTSKISNSFIASITSVTSDGYQGDGEMSRPASRGADHSPMNGLLNNRNVVGQAWGMNAPVPRRQDPMTDSDFFTESDADDLNHRGDRKAQVIDGQLFGAKGTVLPLQEPPPAMDDSCMESSGVFTDIENRADDDMSHRAPHPQDMSPDTDTHSSNNTRASVQTVHETNDLADNTTIQNRHEVNINEDDDDDASSSLVMHENIENDNKKQSIVNHSTVENVNNFNNITTNNSAVKTVSRKQVITSQRKHEMTPRSPFGNKNKIQKLNSLESEDLSSIGSSDSKIRCSPKSVKNRVKPIKSTNKWDAVMNKIAENQKNSSHIKKDLSEVKSKVYCGLSVQKSNNIKITNDNTHQETSQIQTTTQIGPIKRQLFTTGSKR